MLSHTSPAFVLRFWEKKPGVWTKTQADLHVPVALQVSRMQELSLDGCGGIGSPKQALTHKTRGWAQGSGSFKRELHKPVPLSLCLEQWRGTLFKAVHFTASIGGVCCHGELSTEPSPEPTWDGIHPWRAFPFSFENVDLAEQST